MFQQQVLIFCVRYNSDTVGGSKNVNFFDFFIWITFDSNFSVGIGVSLSNSISRNWNGELRLGWGFHFGFD